MPDNPKADPQKVDKQDILDHLRKEGVTNLEEFADFVLKKARGSDQSNQPIVNGVIIYDHGFVTS